MTPQETVLPRKLLELVATLTDRDLALRLKRVWEAAAVCNERLANMNLAALEPKTGEDGPIDPGSWNAISTIINQTVRDVSALAQVMAKEFAAPRSVTAEFSLESSDHHVQAVTGRVFAAVGEKLLTDLASAKRLVEVPRLAMGRWTVLAQVQKLRGSLRRRVSEAVYLTAATCGPVRREDVVPGFAHEVNRAALFRATVADLRRSIEGKLAERKPSVVAQVSDVVTDLELFTHMPAWRHVRADAKRRYLQLKEQLTNAASRKSLNAMTLGAAVAPLLDQLGQMAQRHSREILAEHDRAVVVDAGLRLEQAMLHLELDTGVSSSSFTAALEAVEALYGRAPGLDDFIRHTRGKTLQALSKNELMAWVLELKTRLETLPVPGAERENFER